MFDVRVYLYRESVGDILLILRVLYLLHCFCCRHCKIGPPVGQTNLLSVAIAVPLSAVTFLLLISAYLFFSFLRSEHTFDWATSKLKVPLKASDVLKNIAGQRNLHKCCLNSSLKMVEFSNFCVPPSWLR